MGERDDSNIIALNVINTTAVPRSSALAISEVYVWTALPKVIANGETLPAVLLAKTYVKDGLSDLDRYHAKLGDVGIK